MSRLAAIASVAALTLAAAGCLGSGDGGGGQGRETLTVYVSMPLHGQRASEGRAIVDGVRLALAEARGRAGKLRVRAVYLDDSEDGDWSLARSAANARRAAEDSTSIGYIGDLDSGATRSSLPITNQAEIVQISPASTAIDLTRLPPVGEADPDDYQPSGERTFARVVPADDVQARGAAVWADQLGARQVLVVSDGSSYGEIVADAFAEQAGELGMSVRRTRAGRTGRITLPQDLAGRSPDVVYVAATPDSAKPLLASATRADVIGPDALLSPSILAATTRLAGRLSLTSPFLDPSLLPPRGKPFRRAYRRYARPSPAAAYGYESMALLLEAIRRAGADGDDRGAVIDEVLSTQDRNSILGSYSIDGNGDTTLDRVTGYQISDGLPVFPVALRAPR